MIFGRSFLCVSSKSLNFLNLGPPNLGSLRSSTQEIENTFEPREVFLKRQKTSDLKMLKNISNLYPDVNITFGVGPQLQPRFLPTKNENSKTCPRTLKPSGWISDWKRRSRLLSCGLTASQKITTKTPKEYNKKLIWKSNWKLHLKYNVDESEGIINIRKTWNSWSERFHRNSSGFYANWLNCL